MQSPTIYTFATDWLLRLKVDGGRGLGREPHRRGLRRPLVASADRISLLTWLGRAVILLQRLDHEAPTLEPEAELAARAYNGEPCGRRDERADRRQDADVDQARVARKRCCELGRVCRLSARAAYQGRTREAAELDDGVNGALDPVDEGPAAGGRPIQMRRKGDDDGRMCVADPLAQAEKEADNALQR